MCTVKPYCILAKRFGLFAMRLPSLSRGKWTVGLWHNFGYFYPCLHGSLFFCLLYFNLQFTKIKEKKIHADNLDDGYNIATCKQRYEVHQCLQNICYV